MPTNPSEFANYVKQQIAQAKNSGYNPGGLANTGSPFETQKGLSPIDYTRQVMLNLSQQLSNPNSRYYQQYRSYLGSVTPTLGTNTLLSGLMAGGGYGASQVQANALQKNYLSQRNDFLNQGVQGFASQNLGLSSGLLNSFSNSWLQQKGLQDQNKANQGGALDFLSSPLGALGGNLFSSLFGSGGSAAAAETAAMALPALSDIRMKENIEYTNEKTKDGIPIVYFNYKKNPQRFKGVIAQDVEKIRPDAVTTINGYKHVYYGVL